MEYQLDSLRRAGIGECAIIVGYMAESVRAHFGSYYRGIRLSYVENADFNTTNNLYSLWLAREQFDDDILLLESDLVFDDLLVCELAAIKGQNVAMVDRFQPHMDGTVIFADGGAAKSMVLKSRQGPDFDYRHALKTVNIYRLTKESLQDAIVPEMEEFLEEGQTGQYYEAVFASLMDSDRMSMSVMNTGNRRWAEIDTLGDLEDAERMFATAVVI